MLGLLWNLPAALCDLLASLQLIAWEPEQEEEVTMVTARPNFQDSIHVGFVSGLKKFTEYFTSVLCFTTPGDGPRSAPQLVRTHEDGRHPPALLSLPHPRPGWVPQAEGQPGLISQAEVPPDYRRLSHRW